MPEAEMWTFSNYKGDDKGVDRLGLNFGAPGDRRAGDGTYWIDYPSVGGPSPSARIKLNGKELKYKRRHSALIESGTLPWISASALEGEAEIVIELNRKASGPIELENLVKGRSPIQANRAKLYEDSPAAGGKQGSSSSLGAVSYTHLTLPTKA